MKYLEYNTANRDPDGHYWWKTNVQIASGGKINKKNSSLELLIKDYPRQHENLPNQVEGKS